MHTGTLNAAHAERAGLARRAGDDRCPTTITPHRASDGQILRLRLPGGRIPAAAAKALAGAAARGPSIELTSRGNLQLRGLDPERTAAARSVIAHRGLVPSAPHERALAIVASPLVGRTPGALLGDAFVGAVAAAYCARPETATASGRALTVIDDGAGHAWSAGADLLLCPTDSREGVELLIAGRRAAVAPIDEAPSVAGELFGRLVTAAAAHGVWRAAELPPEVLATLTDVSDGQVGDAAPAAPLPVGLVTQRDGLVAARGVAPLGRLTPEMLRGAGELAAAVDTDVRIDDARGVTLVDLRQASAAAVLEALDELGFLTAPADPAIGLTGCAGADCQRTEVDVRAALELRRTQRRPGAPREHLVGCQRRCGAPAAGVTVVADPADTPQQLAARAARRTMEA